MEEARGLCSPVTRSMEVGVSALGRLLGHHRVGTSVPWLFQPRQPLWSSWPKGAGSIGQPALWVGGEVQWGLSEAVTASATES